MSGSEWERYLGGEFRKNSKKIASVFEDPTTVMFLVSNSEEYKVGDSDYDDWHDDVWVLMDGMLLELAYLIDPSEKPMVEVGIEYIFNENVVRMTISAMWTESNRFVRFAEQLALVLQRHIQKELNQATVMRSISPMTAELIFISGKNN